MSPGCDGVSNSRPSNPGAFKRKKVKTGCRTCKARRVKCDEGRPSCQRCVSTGRTCDGYGIWGDGGRKHAERAVVAKSHEDPVKYAISGRYGKLSPEQDTYFQWFRHRTYTKLPLPFITPFWQTLVLQACAAESSILHAVLALGSAHQKESLQEEEAKESPETLDSQQKFMLQEYGKAMRDLQPHLSSQDRRSVHVALVVCTLFTFFENLLGRYAAANAHLHSGLRLLAETYTPIERPESMAFTTERRGYVDDWIIESFARLHVQAALLGQGLPGLYPRLPKFPLTPIPVIFDSTNEAARYMDRLLLEIAHLVEECSSLDCSAADVTFLARLQDTQQRLQADLKQWIAAYNATDPDAREGFSHIDGFYIRVLRGYHTMAAIIINTCVWPVCETMYDLYIAEFIFMIEQLIAIWKAHVARPAWHPAPWTTDMPRKISHSVGDKGWIPLLYFIAIKCRVHRIRLQAIKLLSQTEHKEGIWDSRLALIIVREVMRIEEGDYYEDFEKDDKFTIVSIPTDEDLTLPPLPDHRRIYNIRVGLPEHSMGVLTLEYEKKQEYGIGTHRRKRCYDLQVRHWVDAAT
ncbi:hypothetical protein O1611_g4160 [Lasiodiplodia mahajangana]|uniref:Uncharacterized protein n=1 Tax=Lasiodiplodia mahajangana TaxID=1108764 RepID=A0ACC2JPP7_9PEZI|nr:hypothetical protein O1611_g4160 [Lasiodiplodia mahajangana]